MAANRGEHLNMRISSLIVGMLASVGSWKSILAECVGAVLAWCCYLVVEPLFGHLGAEFGDLAAMGKWIVPLMFWAAVVTSGLGLLSSSLKSALPALLALFLVFPLYFLGAIIGAYVALGAATVGTVVYAIAFAVHGGRMDERSTG